MEDIAIIDLYWARSEEAIEKTAEKYGRYCTKIAYNILSSDEDSEECVNDTYLSAWKAMPPQRPNRLAAFLGRITRNIALNRFDHRRAQKRNSEFDLLLSELEDCIGTEDTVEAAFRGEETAQVITAFLRSVETEHRNVFLRRYWYVDSIGEVARRFDMSESKVKSLLFRMRKKLKEYLEKEGIAV